MTVSTVVQKIEGREFICIDTGGIDGTETGVETRMAEQSLLAIEEADVVLFMVDARAGLMPADEAIAKHLRSREKPTFLVANKTDGLDPDQAVVDFYSLGLGEIYPIAASHGRGVLSLLEHGAAAVDGRSRTAKKKSTKTLNTGRNLKQKKTAKKKRKMTSTRKVCQSNWRLWVVRT
ncbi:GTP-binding protein EngA [Escherichia coli]|uniref:GTP-binding protein EngA n=1 Tax=Escherichia coli TaxID=562 RepID=A0A3S4LSZ5_ECOLX|nr:GTP-binding protein EngA [Escherichia coli]